MSRQYLTKSIEQAAAIITYTKEEPLLSFGEDGKVTFLFSQTDKVTEVVMSYENSEARVLLETRNNLFRRMRVGK
jgi:hypothetical protein